MAEPLIAQKSPYAVEMAAGDYWWCACGQSRRQPFCDGSHKGSGLSPVRFSISESQKMWLCGCKGSSNQPFCDGSHKKIGTDPIFR